MDSSKNKVSKHNKYKNQKIVIDTIRFDSKDEGRYYQDYIKPRLVSGEYLDVEFHPKFTLLEKFVKDNKKFRALTYSADFRIYPKVGASYLVDVKGMITKDFIIKYKLFNYIYYELELKIIVWDKKEKIWKEVMLK